MGTSALNATGNALNNGLYANTGNNHLDGDTGTDTLSYLYGASAGITANLAITTTQATGGSGNDTLLNIENLIGSSFNDRLTGNSGNNVLNGGLGNDILTGGSGKDSLTGGSGNDTFDFNALSELGLGATRDVITDFTQGQDTFDLATIDSNTSLAGDQAFTFVSSFTATAGQLRYSDGIVYFNTDADTAAEYEIQLTGNLPTTLSATNFSL
jgi:Ca2+-binding RTX toxin-like protein